MSAAWWRQAAVYQVYLRSFLDSDGDGVGDLDGLRSRLGLLADLGVDTLWLSPIHPSPDADFGYDVADYDGVHPALGDHAAFDALLAECRDRGLRVLLDGVFNHTSDQHRWFQRSAAEPDGPFGAFYHWVEGTPDTPPNNWGSVFGGPAWTWHPGRGAWFLHLFTPQQPDLNWAHPPVAEGILASMERWLGRGVSGFRLDVFNLYAKAAGLPDNPVRVPILHRLYPFGLQRHPHDRDQPALAGILQQMRALADRHDAVLIGETLDETLRYDNAAPWVGDDRLHAAFHFRWLHSRWGARPFARAMRAGIDALGPDGWPTWVVGNHDVQRAFSRWGGREDRMKLVALMQCTLRGTPVVYQGDELGLPQQTPRRAELLDPPGRRFWPVFRGRDGCRTPLPWDSSASGGFTTGEPWLPVTRVPQEQTLLAQRSNPTSLWRFWQAALRLRRETPALLRGDQEGPTEGDRQLLVWTRRHHGQVVLCAFNPSDRPARLAGVARSRLLLGTHGRPQVEEGALHLRPCEGVVLERLG